MNDDSLSVLAYGEAGVNNNQGHAFAPVCVTLDEGSLRTDASQVAKRATFARYRGRRNYPLP